MLRFKYAAWFVLLVLLVSGCATSPDIASIRGPGVYHIVGSGQTLYRIAKTYGVDMRQIMRVNNIQDPNNIGVGERLFIPNASRQFYVSSFKRQAPAELENVVGQKRYNVAWRTITLHHSGTASGNAEAFDRDHRRRRMGGLFYHFVIGNGTGSGDGEVEVGWRWIKQDEVNRRRDIQICLVGDYNRQQVTPAQYSALIGLLKILQKQYSVPVYRLRIHRDIPGSATECPGKNFPLKRIISDLKK